MSHYIFSRQFEGVKIVVALLLVECVEREETILYKVNRWALGGEMIGACAVASIVQHKCAHFVL